VLNDSTSFIFLNEDQAKHQKKTSNLDFLVVTLKKIFKKSY